MVGAGVVKIQLGGVQETRVSSPVSPNTLRMYLGDEIGMASSHGFENPLSILPELRITWHGIRVDVNLKLGGKWTTECSKQN